MKALIVKFEDNYPNYGAKELKINIRKNTINGFAITSTLLLIIFSISLIRLLNVVTNPPEVIFVSNGPIDLIDLIKEKPVSVTMNIPFDKYFTKGTSEQAGKFKPVDDALITPNIKEFATTENIGNTSTGDASDPFQAGFGNGQGNPGEVKVEINKTPAEEPSPDDIVFYEKEPGLDYDKLKSLVKYPELARKAGIEGKVSLRVLIDVDGALRKLFVEDSENMLLNQAAIDAVNAYGKFKPAIQNGEAIMVWISIPIQFKLK
jgi:protein TonB